MKKLKASRIGFWKTGFPKVHSMNSPITAASQIPEGRVYSRKVVD